MLLGCCTLPHFARAASHATGPIARASTSCATLGASPGNPAMLGRAARKGATTPGPEAADEELDLAVTTPDPLPVDSSGRHCLVTAIGTNLPCGMTGRSSSPGGGYAALAAAIMAASRPVWGGICVPGRRGGPGLRGMPDLASSERGGCIGRTTPGGIAARMHATWACTQAGEAASVTGATAGRAAGGGPAGGGGCQGRAERMPAAGRDNIAPVVFGGGGGG